ENHLNSVKDNICKYIQTSNIYVWSFFIAIFSNILLWKIIYFYRGEEMKVIYIKKQHFLIGAVILILLLGVLKIRDLRVKQVIYLPITNKIVAIDAGHGGLDPGTVSKSGIREDEINLKIARNLQRLIEHSGGIVV